MYIRSGVATESVRNLYNSIESVSKKLNGWAIDPKKMQTTSDGALVFLLTSDDEWMPQFKLRFGPMQQTGESTYKSEISFKAPNNRINSNLMEFEYTVNSDGTLVPSEESIDKLSELIDEYEDEVLLKLVNQSKHLDLKLSKINGSINITSAISSYSLLDSIDDIDTLLNDSEFVSDIPNCDSVAVEVCSDGNCLDYSICDNIFSEYQYSTSQALISICRSLVPAILNLQYLALNCCGYENQQLKAYYDNMLWEIRDMFTQCSELCVADSGECPNPLEYIGSDAECVSKDLAPQIAVNMILQPIIECIEFYKLSIQDSRIVDLLNQFSRSLLRWRNYIFRY